MAHYVWQIARGTTSVLNSYQGPAGELVLNTSTSHVVCQLGNDSVELANKTDIPDIATSATNGLMSSTDKAKLDAFNASSTYATKADLTALSQGVVQIVASLPSTGTEGVIYLVAISGEATKYTAYAWENNAFAKFGEASLDLSNYALKSNTLSNISLSGATFTLTKGDNTTSTFTLSTATTSANGLMSSTDKSKLNGIQANATKVSVTQTLTSGTKIASISVNGTSTSLYAPASGTNNYVTVTGTNIDLSQGDVFYKALSANTTFTFSNLPTGSGVRKITVILKNADTYTVTWPSSVQWVRGAAPSIYTNVYMIEFTILGTDIVS